MIQFKNNSLTPSQTTIDHSSKSHPKTEQHNPHHTQPTQNTTHNQTNTQQTHI